MIFAWRIASNLEVAILPGAWRFAVNIAAYLVVGGVTADLQCGSYSQ